MNAQFFTPPPGSQASSGRSTPVRHGDKATTPRILCLHGGGTSAQIFQIQTVRLARILAPHFRLEFLDGPFVAPPGPGVHPFFEGMDPYYRWARRAPSDDGERLREALRRKLAEPGGEWAGLLGFSQGSALSMGLLCEQERAMNIALGADDEDGLFLGNVMPGGRPTDFRFAILCNGSYPPIRLSSGTTEHPDATDKPFDEKDRDRVSTPTIHVHGLKDFVLERSRKYIPMCRQGSATVFEYDLEHRMPIDAAHNEQIKKAVMDIWNKSKGGEAELVA